jgi:hypothetical protein
MKIIHVCAASVILYSGFGAIKAVPAAAADMGADCCSDLEERIAELESVTAERGNRKVSVTISGYVNETVMGWDDGVMRDAYILTNEDWQDRFRISGQAQIAKGWKAGYVAEIGLRGSHADRVNQFDSNGEPCINCPSIRQSVWYLENENLGRIWMGLTGDAADCITEITLSNTLYFGYTNAWGNIFGDSGGGFFVRRSDDVLSTLHWGQFVAQGVAQGIPGEGHRYNLVKYETPSIAGFKGSASWGEDDMWNVALRYEGAWAGLKAAGGIAYTQSNDLAPAVRRGAGKTEEVGLSVSLMHVETGLFGAGAWGRLHDAGLDDLYGRPVDENTEFFTLQFGIERQWLPVGKTTIFGEYFQLDRGAGFSFGPGNIVNPLDATSLGTGLDEVASSRIKGWSFGINQNLNEYVDLYLNYRWFELDVTTTDNLGAASANVKSDPLQAVLAGAMVRF